jgi:ADP-heptose:LPS heptosyltransferase
VKLSFSLHLLNFLAGPPLRVGVRSIDGVTHPGRRFLNVMGDFDWDSALTHQRLRNRDIARLLDCDIPDEELFRNTITVTPEDDADARACLEAAGIPPDAVIVGIHPGAGSADRIWPAERFAALCSAISAQNAVRVVTVVGPVDDAIVLRVSAAFDAAGVPLTVLRGASFGVTCTLLRRMALFVVNDTGPLHLAAALGVETVALFNPVNVHIWAPRMPNVHRCVSPNGRIDDIPVDMPLAYCRDILTRRGV